MAYFKFLSQDQQESQGPAPSLDPEGVPKVTAGVPKKKKPLGRDRLIPQAEQLAYHYRSWLPDPKDQEMFGQISKGILGQGGYDKMAPGQIASDLETFLKRSKTASPEWRSQVSGIAAQLRELDSQEREEAASIQTPEKLAETAALAEQKVAKLRDEADEKKAQLSGAGVLGRAELQREIQKAEQAADSWQKTLDDHKGRLENGKVEQAKIAGAIGGPFAGLTPEQLFKQASSGVTKGQGAPPLSKAVGDFMKGLNLGGMVGFLSKGPMALHLRTVLDSAPEGMQQKILGGLQSMSQDGVTPQTLPPGRKGDEIEKLKAKEQELGSEGKRIIQELQAARGMDSFGGVLMWVMFSLLMGPKLASLFMIDRAKEGQLEFDLDNVKRQIEANEKSMEYERRLLDEASMRAVERTAAKEGRIELKQMDQKWQDYWRGRSEASKLQKEARDQQSKEAADAYDKVVKVFGNATARIHDVSTQIDDLAKEIERYEKAFKPVPAELDGEYDRLISEREALMAERDEIDLILRQAAAEARRKAGIVAPEQAQATAP